MNKVAIGLLLMEKVCCDVCFCETEMGRADVDIQGQGGGAGELVFNVWAQDFMFYRDNVFIDYSVVNDSTTAVEAFLNQSDEALFVSLESKLLDEYNSEGIYQLPILATALTICYKLPSLNSTDKLIIDVDVLVDIWLGNITKWNDPAIGNLNPDIKEKLPDLDIKLALDGTPMSRTGVLFKAMANASFTFANVWQSNSYNALPTVQNGRATVFYDRNSLISHLMNNDGALTQLVLDEALDLGIPYAHLINTAGYHLISQSSIHCLLTLLYTRRKRCGT